MSENQHCGKHDKIFTDEQPCPGCETEKAAATPEKSGEEEKKDEDEEPSAPRSKKGKK